jgi:hypothetical protein
LPGQPLEASLPRGVKVNQDLCADVPRRVSEPGHRSPKSRQFVDLVEGRRQTGASAEVEQALRMRGVPKGT